MSSGRGVYRGIYSSLVDSPDFQLLSPRARHVFLTMRVMREIGPGCIWRYYLEPIAVRTGWKPKEVEASLVELENAHDCYGDPDPWIVREGVILWIKKGLLHDPTLRLSDIKHQTAVKKSIASLPHLDIVVKFCEYYHLPRPFDGPSKGHGSHSDDPHPPSTDQDHRLQTPYIPQNGLRVAENGFGKFWSAYPRKVAKQSALKAWKKIHPDEGLLWMILGALELQSKSEVWVKDGGSFIPHAATWLNGRRWEDEMVSNRPDPGEEFWGKLPNGDVPNDTPR